VFSRRSLLYRGLDTATRCNTLQHFCVALSLAFLRRDLDLDTEAHTKVSLRTNESCHRTLSDKSSLSWVRDRDLDTEAHKKGSLCTNESCHRTLSDKSSLSCVRDLDTETHKKVSLYVTRPRMD